MTALSASLPCLSTPSWEVYVILSSMHLVAQRADRYEKRLERRAGNRELRFLIKFDGLFTLPTVRQFEVTSFLTAETTHPCSFRMKLWDATQHAKD
jgi:hypothetical protein